MFGLKKREPLDLDAPRKPGEVEFSNLQLTRLGNWFEKKFSTFVKSMVGVVAIFVLGMLIATLNAKNTDDTLKDRQSFLTATLEEIVAVRTEARKQTCERDKRFSVAHNAGFQAVENKLNGFIEALYQFTVDPDDDPSDVAEARKFVDAQKAAITAELQATHVEVPDCSARGIEDFYNGDRGDGDGTTTTTEENDS